jgi:cytochrome b
MEQSLRAAPDAADVELTLQNYRRRQRSVTQYAALNMGACACAAKCLACRALSGSERAALLHFTFGHDEMALRFIHESLLIAQQNADHVCIHHALVLLCRVRSRASLVRSCTPLTTSARRRL